MSVKTRIQQWLKLATRESARGNNRGRRIRGYAARVESLESRTLLTAYTVTNLNDAGAGSLRAAISQANGNSGADTITFATSGTITLSSGELAITDSVTITGPGADKLAVSGGHTATRIFLIDNSNASLIDVAISNITISDGGDGITSINGAGVRSSENLTLRGVAVTGNDAANLGGGGIQIFGGNFVLQDSTVANNRANQGGGIELFGNSATVINATISGNQANGHGGGLIALIGATTVLNSTISNNRCDADGSGGGVNGGAAGNVGLLTLHNTIVAGNFQGTGTTPWDASLLTASSSHNLIGFAGSDVGLTDGVNGNIVGVNGSGNRDVATILNTILADNGGRTQTHALVTGSAAIDSGSNGMAIDANGAALTHDQRGAPFGRILDGDNSGGPPANVDMGAFEFSGLRLLSPSPNAFTLRPTLTWTPIAGATSYIIQINNESTDVPHFHDATTAIASYTPTVDLAIGKFKMWVRPIFGVTLGNWSSPLLFNNLTATIWQSMPRTQLTSRPTLNWNALPGAARYDLWIDNFSTGQKQVIRQEVTGTSFTPAADLPMGLYRCWIRGIDAKTNFAGWSVLQELLVIPGPIPFGPLSATFDRTPTFTWNPVAGAVSYELYVRNQNTGAMVINGTSTAATNFTPATDLTDGPYRWWTLAVSPANIGPIKSGGSNPTDIYVGGRPTIIAPVAGSSTSDRTPTFTWRAVDGAASYQLTVDRINVPQAGIISQTGLTTASFTPTAALPVGTYRAWVRAVSTTGELSPWSTEVNFTITAIAPTIDSPDADLMLTGLLTSERAQRNDLDADAHESQIIVRVPPDRLTVEAVAEAAAPAVISSPSVLPVTNDQQPALLDLDRLLMEFARHEFAFPDVSDLQTGKERVLWQ